MELYFRKQGQGPNIVILHGLFGSSDNWMSISKMLSDDYTVWTIDQRNHGQSPHSDEWNYKVMAEDLEEFIEDHNIHKPFLIGHSMGGKTVMQFLIHEHMLIPKAIIADIGPKAYPIQHKTILEGLNAIDFEKAESRGDIEAQLKEYVPEFGVRAFLLKNVRRTEEGKYEWMINLPVISRDIEIVGEGYSENHMYQGEVMFLRGSKSDYVMDEDRHLIKSIFPKAEIKTLEGAGHWLHAEKPEEFVEVVKEFFGN